MSTTAVSVQCLQHTINTIIHHARCPVPAWQEPNVDRMHIRIEELTFMIDRRLAMSNQNGTRRGGNLTSQALSRRSSGPIPCLALLGELESGKAGKRGIKREIPCYHR